MSPEENKAVVRRVIEQFINGGDESVADECYHPDWHHQRVGFPTMAQYLSGSRPVGGTGIAGVKRGLRGVKGAFPDLRYEDVELVADGDLVAGHWTFTGTHSGNFLGLAPTGKEITMEQAAFWRMKDGKLERAWFISDELAFLLQMGWTLVPPAGGGWLWMKEAKPENEDR